MGGRVKIRRHADFSKGLDKNKSPQMAPDVSKQGGVGGPVALASGYENTYPLPNRPE